MYIYIKKRGSEIEIEKDKVRFRALNSRSRSSRSEKLILMAHLKASFRKIETTRFIARKESERASVRDARANRKTVTRAMTLSHVP